MADKKYEKRWARYAKKNQTGEVEVSLSNEGWNTAPPPERDSGRRA
jgi:hypothetical protein